ncbi:MAG: hypothetical protein WCF04_10995 [Candidatus Nanopelagicales bacterium]
MVDVELIVCGWLASQLPGTAVGTTLVGWRAGDPHVLVRRSGGRVRYGWLDEAEITCEVRAGTRQAAADLTGSVRDALGRIAAEHTTTDGVLSRSVELTGPAWVPDADGQGSYEVRWQVSAHPTRGD